MDLFLYSIFLVSSAIGTGSSFISDAFFIFSFKNHHIKNHEYNIIGRLQIAGLLSAGIAILSKIFLVALEFESGALINEGLQYVTIFILGLIFITTLIIRRFHLPALKRNQLIHSHLSDSFKEHHDSLITSSALNLFSWLYILFAISLEQQHQYIVNSFILFLFYIAFSFGVTQLAQQIKGFYKPF